MNKLLPPKYMRWNYSLDQRYYCNQKQLITSGCSFTASTSQLDCAASWPGYVRDRCRFEETIDLSYPGMGNDYIYQSIKQYANTNSLVIVMWSGIDRQAISMDPPVARIPKDLSNETKKQRALMSFEMVQELKKELVARQIPHAFTQYINLIHPPFLAWRDTTGAWPSYLDNDQLNKLKDSIDIPTNPNEFLYDYAFFNDHLNAGDFFHPPVECNLSWTDQVLLPNLAKKGLIHSVDR